MISLIQKSFYGKTHKCHFYDHESDASLNEFHPFRVPLICYYFRVGRYKCRRVCTSMLVSIAPNRLISVEQRLMLDALSTQNFKTSIVNSDNSDYTRWADAWNGGCRCVVKKSILTCRLGGASHFTSTGSTISPSAMIPSSHCPALISCPPFCPSLPFRLLLESPLPLASAS